MSNFKIDIQGLNKITQELSQDKLNKQLIVAIGTEINQLHNALKFAVHSTYALDKSLDTVLKGKSRSTVQRSKNLIESSIEYVNKPVRLAEFPFQVKILLVKNRMMLPDRSLRFASPSNKIRAKQYSVMVKRAGGYKEIYGKTGRGAFRTNKVPSGKVQLLERQQDATWKIEPVTRAWYKPLFGPSLANMANTQLREDSKVKQLIDTLEARLAGQINL